MTIVLIEDDPALRELLEEELEAKGYRVNAFETAEEALTMINNGSVELVLTDLRLPGMDGMALLNEVKALPSPPMILLMTAFGSAKDAVAALKQGADDFLTKPVDIEHLLLTVERLLKQRAMQHEVKQYREQVSPIHGMIGNSEVMRRLFDQIGSLARSESSVLITGESGTGKELVARAIHQASPRAQKPFVAVNCAGIPHQLMESEFFGHASGAYTGAKSSRPGLFREADGGTLLLDELGEMPLELQAKLLRVLQENRLRPVGSDNEVQVDVRILAATNQNLPQQAENGTFRADLFYRLETFSLLVPPLREREQDISLLAWHFVKRLREQGNQAVQGIDKTALAILQHYDFPGNVRELQNIIERACVFCQGHWITPADLPERIRNKVGEVAPLTDNENVAISELEGWPTLEHIRSQYVRKVMDYTNGNKQQAAQILGVTRRTLYRWLDELDNG